MIGTSTVTQEKQISVRPQVVAKCLGGIVLVLLVANITGVILESVLHSDARHTRLLVRYFDFNGESNIPAFFSSILLLLAGLLLLLIHVQAQRFSDTPTTRHWLILGMIFLFMAVDENVQLHEHVAEFVRPKLATDLSGLLHWAWVVPYAVLTLAVVVYFAGFVLRLPRRIAKLIILAGAVFVTGALGLELVEGYLYKRYGIDHLYNRIMYCLEELMEMSGVVVFIYALLLYLARHGTQVAIVHEGSDA